MIASIGGTFLYLFSELVYRTGRFTITGLERAAEIDSRKESVILTSWHGMTMMVIGFIRKKMKIDSFNVIIPDDHRGANLEVFANWLGAKSFRLNLKGDSTMGTGRKLVRVIQDIKGGRNFLIHPDGPAGPAYRVKPGLAYIAGKTNTKILPLGCYCRHAYHIARWDRYTLPLPFSRIHIQVGKPIQVDEDEQLPGETNRMIENTLNRLTFQAAANYYELS